ncbi:sirohydrochlorin cobaltochelatase [Geothermobacter ehrlichii]|uniref:Sirohydrochlorin cobaltochelatase n=1 Tax=Geothermobacter ehrlichii TaxID=213224 RepID=A0A5D3WJY3_9BACT|nr:sirohydrochlorin cobaltochelatase [Geothermobacter ehrlichii]TYO99272.1 sirohydrochlorin cobaltochelatase [Geothermobacter ehrlichii]
MQKTATIRHFERTTRALPFLLALLLLPFYTTSAWSMTRTLKREPAIVIVAFGTTTRAMVTYDAFEKQLRRELPAKYQKLKIEWAFTSEIVRERANKKFKAQGIDKRFLSLPQVLANLENDGYRKVAIQSLHIFPGQEFKDMERQIDAFRQIGLRIEYGGTLLHEWPWVFETIDSLEPYFLPPDQGCNVLVAHGTPETFPGSNATYLGLDRYLSEKYDNVFVGGVDGILTREQALARARACKVKRVRLVPFMYVAGDHIMNDIMGTKPDDKGVPSWAMELEQAGIEVDSLTVEYEGKTYFRGLGFYEKINRNYIRQLQESLKRLEEL